MISIYPTGRCSLDHLIKVGTVKFLHYKVTLSPYFPCLFISIRTHGSPFYSMGYMLFYHYLAWCSNCSRFSQWGTHQAGFCVLLTYLPLFWGGRSTSLLSGTMRCPTIDHLYFFWPRPGSQPFLQRILIPYSEGCYLETNIWATMVYHHRVHPNSVFLCL